MFAEFIGAQRRPLTADAAEAPVSRLFGLMEDVGATEYLIDTEDSELTLQNLL